MPSDKENFELYILFLKAFKFCTSKPPESPLSTRFKHRPMLVNPVVKVSILKGENNRVQDKISSKLQIPTSKLSKEDNMT